MNLTEYSIYNIKTQEKIIVLKTGIYTIRKNRTEKDINFTQYWCFNSCAIGESKCQREPILYNIFFSLKYYVTSVFKTGSPYVSQAGLKLVNPTSAS